MSQSKELQQHLKKYKIKHLYHATFYAVLGSIDDDGLGATPSHRINAWQGMSKKKHVYLSHSPTIAEGFAESADNPKIPEDWKGEIVVLKIDINDLDFKNLSFDDNNLVVGKDKENMTFKYKGIIPNDKIKVLEEDIALSEYVTKYDLY